MKKILPGLIFPVILFLITSCAEQYAVTDPSLPLEVSAGSEFYIAVPSNPTTGYHWQVMNDWDPNIFVTIGTEYQSTSSPNVIGGGGIDIWKFKAVGAGEDVFTISNFPPGNTDTPEETMTFTVKVK